MDRKSIIVIALCFVFIGLWSYVLMPKLYPPKPLPPGWTNVTSTAASPTATATNPSAPSPTASATPEAPVAAPRFAADTNIPERLIEVTNSTVHYTFTSHGGGLKEVELLDYPETVSTRLEKQTKANRVATLNKLTPAPTLALLDGETLQGDGIFTLTKTATGVRAEKAFTNGLVIVKEFQVGTNYLVTTTVRLENHSARPLDLPVHEWVVGTATPMDARDNNSMTIGVLWYNGTKTEDIGASYFSSHGFACVPRIPPTEYRGGASNVVWVAAHNQFFALALMPPQPAQQVVIRKVDLPRPTGEEARMVATNAAQPEGYEAALVYPALTLGPSQSLERQFALFAGPKEYQTLARISATLNNNIDLVMSYSGFFGFFAKALLLAMNMLHNAVALSYGWAVVAITVIIKLIFWPLTRASTRSMKRMQALQPQLNAIKEKYKGDAVKMNRKTMEFMKEHKVNPMGGCLPMLIQIPVFFGFYRMIQSAIELRGAHFLWVTDLSKPDILFVVPGLGFVPFFGIPGVGLPFNLLPLIMGATMLWQARLTPPSPGMDPTQAKIMRYMPLIFMLGLYNFSAGLTLYWTVNNLLTIAQTKLTKTGPEPALPGAAPILTPPQKKRK
jgi:YidC/Oxa1 family membrane protein insertase